MASQLKAVGATTKIEKGIPLPEPANRRGGKYPFAEMEVGDSFLIPGAKTSKEIASSISYQKMRYGREFACRAVDGGLRVWRSA